MLKETRNYVVVHIPDVQDKGIAVTVFNITGNIENCQDAYSHLKQRKPMIGLWRTLSRCGVRN